MIRASGRPGRRPVISALAALITTSACRDTDPADKGVERPDETGEPPDSETHTDTDTGGEGPVERDGPWVRDEESTPGSIVFTEILYNSGSETGPEWIELHNPMALDMDLSGWSLDGGIQYTFAEGALIEAGGYLVVAADPSRLDVDALGPYEGSLSDGGERINLRSNGGRRMDTVEYADDDPWPVAADGSGLSLSKEHNTDASDHAERWTVSAELGGTPGAANGVDPLMAVTEVELLPLDSTWSFDDSGAYPSGDWTSADYDDSAWDVGEAPFYAGEATGDELVTVRITADNYYALYAGEADGADLRLIAEDSDGDWTTVESFDAELSARDHLYITAWEAPGSDGGPQMLIAEAEGSAGIVGTGISTYEWTLGPVGGCPGTTPPDPAPDVDELLDLIADDTWEAPAVDAAPSSDPWGWALSSSFDSSTAYIWPDTFSSTSITNTDNTYSLFRSVEPALGSGGTTELPAGVITTTFRTSFELDADPSATELLASCTLDDGAVFYLNGVEVHRENMPSGSVDAGTLASAASDGETLSLNLGSDALVRGANVLAVEVHQAEVDDEDMLFGCALTARISSASAEPTMVLNELPRAASDPFWVEIGNVSDTVQDSSGLVLASSAGDQIVLPDGALATGALSQVEAFPVSDGDVLYLYSADRSRLLDAARVRAWPRGRLDGGDWYNLTETSPGEANAVDLHEDVVINEIMYHHAPGVTEAGYVENNEEWIELYNRGAETVDLGGWQLVDAVAFTFPEGATLEPGASLVISNDAVALAEDHPGVEILGDFEGGLSDSSDRILLLDADGNPADEVRYYDDGRWPHEADGSGSSLELQDPWADNGAAEAWAASDETTRTAWVHYEWEGTAESSPVGPDGTWQEFVLGLLDEGEVLIDDLSVIENPATYPTELIQNGSFDDLDHWRLLGNHRHSELVPDPDDPSDSVLRLVATGPTGHMHDHAETTLTASIRETNYKVSFRARHVSGSNQLNTRLYFNRFPHTALLTQADLSGTPGTTNSTAVDNLGPTFDDLSQDVAVPAAGEPVAVRVRVDDPDEVAAVTLWSSVDGGAFEATEMDEADGLWSASLEGQDAGAVVQFYVEAEDGLGQTSTFPAAGADSRALIQFDDGQAETNGLHNLRLIMTGEDTDWLHEDVNLMSNDRVGGTVVYDESEVFYDVGVRTKGSERGRPEDVRIGYAVSFNPEHLFRGSHGSVLLDRSEGVGYGQRELLLNLVMMRAGIVSAEYNDLTQLIAPVSGYTGAAELQLDRSTNLVLDNQFEHGADGYVYDYELIYYPTTTEDGTAEGLKLPQPDTVVGTTITDLGDDKEAYRWNFTLQNNLRQDEYGPFMALGQAFSLRGTDAFLDEAEAVIDVDQWMRAFAIATLAGAVDQYGGDSSQHNARFYMRPDDGLMLYFPHDLDFFGGSSMAVIGNTDLYYLIQDPVNERTYYQHLNDIIAAAYNLDYLQPWCDQLAELLPSQDWDYSCGFVEDRAAWVTSGSSDSVSARFPAVSFAITTNGGADFSTSASEVTLEGQGWIDVREIWLSGEALELSWTDGTTWQVTVPLVEGANSVVLEATDLNGAVVGSDTITVTRGG